MHCGLCDHVVAMNKSSRLDFMEGYTEDDFKGLRKDGRSKRFGALFIYEVLGPEYIVGATLWSIDA